MGHPLTNLDEQWGNIPKKQSLSPNFNNSISSWISMTLWSLHSCNVVRMMTHVEHSLKLATCVKITPLEQLTLLFVNATCLHESPVPFFAPMLQLWHNNTCTAAAFVKLIWLGEPTFSVHFFFPLCTQQCGNKWNTAQSNSSISPLTPIHHFTLQDHTSCGKRKTELWDLSHLLSSLLHCWWQHPCCVLLLPRRNQSQPWTTSCNRNNNLLDQSAKAQSSHVPCDWSCVLTERQAGSWLNLPHHGPWWPVTLLLENCTD